MFRSVILSVLLSLLQAVFAQGADMGSAIPLAPKVCDCGDTCTCPPGVCPSGCPLLTPIPPPAPPACGPNGCPIAVGSVPTVAATSSACSSAHVPFMQRPGLIRGLLHRIRGR